MRIGGAPVAPGGYSFGESLSVNDVVMHLVATVDSPDFTEGHARTFAELLDARDLRGDDQCVTIGFSREALALTIGSFFQTSHLHGDIWSQLENSLAPIFVSEGHHPQFGRAPDDTAENLAYWMNDHQPWWRTSFGGEWRTEDFLPVTAEMSRREMRPDGKITDDHDGFSGKGARDDALITLMAAQFPAVERDIITRAVESTFYVQPEVEREQSPLWPQGEIMVAGLSSYDSLPRVLDPAVLSSVELHAYLVNANSALRSVQDTLRTQFRQPTPQLTEFLNHLRQFIAELEAFQGRVVRGENLPGTTVQQWGEWIAGWRASIVSAATQSRDAAFTTIMRKMAARIGVVADALKQCSVLSATPVTQEAIRAASSATASASSLPSPANGVATITRSRPSPMRGVAARAGAGSRFVQSIPDPRARAAIVAVVALAVIVGGWFLFNDE